MTIKNNIEKGKKNIKKNLRIILLSTAVVGGVYLMGLSKGVELGRRVGIRAGREEGYDKAISDISYIVKESRDKIEQ